MEFSLYLYNRSTYKWQRNIPCSTLSLHIIIIFVDIFTILCSGSLSFDTVYTADLCNFHFGLNYFVAETYTNMSVEILLYKQLLEISVTHLLYVEIFDNGVT